jgi:hypothetical protein
VNTYKGISPPRGAAARDNKGTHGDQLGVE